MANTNKYNGWQNYYTWCISLHLLNDYGFYSYIMEWKERLIADGAKDEELAYELSEFIKEMVDNYFIDNAPDAYMITDLLGYALCECNFIEIAKAFIE